MVLSLRNKSRTRLPIRIPIIIMIIIASSPLAGSLACGLPSRTAAQQENSQERDKKNKQKALKLLDELLAKAEELTSIDERLFVMTKAAGLLWETDEPRARKLTERVKDELFKARDQLRQKMAGDPMRQISGDAESHDVIQEYQPLIALRGQLLDSLAAKDPDFTLVFLMATQPVFSDVKGIAARDESYLEITLAPLFAAKNPELAYRYAKKLLSNDHEASAWAIDTWKNLRMTAPELSVKLLNDMVVKLKSSRPANKRYLKSDSLNKPFVMHLALAIKAARLGPDQEKKRKGDGSLPIHASYREEQEAYREILKIIVGQAMSLSQKELSALKQSYKLEDLISDLERLTPAIEELLPSQKVMIWRKLDQMESSLDKTTREMREDFRKNYDTQGESAKEDSAAPSSESVEEFKEYYQELMRKIPSSPSEEERAASLADLANLAFYYKVEKEAREALEKAITTIGDKMSTARQIHTQTRIARACVMIDPNRGFEIIAAVMKRIDRLYIGARDFYVFMTGDRLSLIEGRAWTPLVGSANEAASVMQMLASKDFDRAAEVIRLGQMNYLRLMIAFSLLEDTLGGAKKT